MKISKRILVVTICIITAALVGYVVFDGRKSVNNFYIAADRGDAPTQTSLGIYYYQGKLFPQDFTKAMKWWRRAAEQGYAEAQFDLAHMYWFGEGIPKDPVQSYMWMSLSASQNYKNAVTSLADIEKSMTPDQIAEAKKCAAEWKPKPESKP